MLDLTPPLPACALWVRLLLSQVVSGSVLGVQAANSKAACPDTMISVKLPSGGTACVMCGPGFYMDKGACQ